MGPDYYDDLLDYRCDCCDQKDDRIDGAAKELKTIISFCYGDTPPTHEKLEDALEQLCGYLDVDFPIDGLKIRRRIEK